MATHTEGNYNMPRVNLVQHDDDYDNGERETLDFMVSAIGKAKLSCHAAIERHDWRQVRRICTCIMALERSIDTIGR